MRRLDGVGPRVVWGGACNLTGLRLLSHQAKIWSALSLGPALTKQPPEPLFGRLELMQRLHHHLPLAALLRQVLVVRQRREPRVEDLEAFPFLAHADEPRGERFVLCELFGAKRHEHLNDTRRLALGVEQARNHLRWG